MPSDSAGSAVGKEHGLGALVSSGDQLQSTIAVYEVEIDLNAESATSRLKEVRGAQQSELYNLEIGAFLSDTDFRIESASFSPTTVDLRYVTTHPFPSAADLFGTPTAGNREDLAATGRILWLLADPDGETYFEGDGDVRVNTRLITNADGYFKPGPLVNTSGNASNTFPYQLLVDETLDNRVGVSNGGNMQGNYGTSGWGVSEFQQGVTGFGIWAQGQSSVHTLSIDRAALAADGPVRVDAAIVVKYEDPRAGANGPEKRSNRLPSGNMTYRMPHGALDVETILDVAAGAGFQQGLNTNATINLSLRDWDARATEHTAVNLADATNPTLVSLGESGAPIVDIDIPSISGTNGDVLTDDGDLGKTGQAQSELAYTGLVDGTPTVLGPVTGLVRARDIVDVIPPTGWDLNRFNLPEGVLVPIAGLHTEGASYQTFTVTVLPGTDPVTGSWTVEPLAIPDGGVVNVTASGVNATEPGSTMVGIEVNWDDGNGFVQVASGLPEGAGPFGPFPSPAYALSNPSAGEERTLAVRFIDEIYGARFDGTNVGGDTITISPYGGGNTPPTGQFSVSPLSIFNNQKTNITVANVSDPDSPNFDIQAQYTAGGSWYTLASNRVPGSGPFGPYQTLAYTLEDPQLPETHTISVRLVDSITNIPAAISAPGGSTVTVNPSPGGNTPPSGQYSVSPLTIFDGGTTDVTVSNVSDSDSPTFAIEVEYSAGDGFVTVASGLTPGPGPFGPYTTPAYDLTNPSIPETHTITVRLIDGTSGTGSFAGNVGGNVVTVNPLPPCTPGSLGSPGNLTLAVLTTGAVPRSGIGSNQAITGARLGWSAVTDAAVYLVQRAEWPNGTLAVNATFVDLGEVTTTTYDDTTFLLNGQRYLYRVYPRCSFGGPNGASASQLAMLSTMDFETYPDNTDLTQVSNPLAGDWLVNYEADASDIRVEQTNALIGSRSFEVTSIRSGGTERWATFSPPAMTAADLTFLGALTTGRLEFVHSIVQSMDTDGTAMLLRSTRPANGGATSGFTHVPLAQGVAGTLLYNSALASAISTEFGVAAPGGNWIYYAATGEQYSAWEITPAQLTANNGFVFVGWAGNENIVRDRIDDIAWVVY